MKCSSYQVNIENICPNTPCINGCYNVVCEISEKDKLISQLKSHIFELELREKDYNILNERYNQLLCEISKLNDCKLQLECEKKIREEKYNKTLCELEGENSNLQLGFNEKLTSNKTIFSENNCLGKEIELKDAEICQLKLKLNDLSIQLKKNGEDRNSLQSLSQSLTDINSNQSIKLSQLCEDNKTLKDICNEQDCCLKGNALDRANLGKEFEAKNMDIKNLNASIVKHINDQNNLQCELNKFNGLNLQFQNNIKEYEAQHDVLKCENENLKNNLVKEKSCRINEDQKNNQLNNILADRDKKVEMLTHDINTITILQQKASNRNCVLQDENAKLRNHILVLTDLNQKLMNEIDNVIEEDAKMKSILDRKERISSVLMSNRCTIDQSLNNLDAYINNRKCCDCPTPCTPIYDC